MRKKVISLMILAVIFCTAGVSAQFRWGPMLGLDVTSLKYKQDLITIDRSVGFSAGVVTEFMFPGIGFGVSSGIYYQQRGATLNLGERQVWASLGYGKERSYLHYATIPIHLRFKWTRMSGLEDYIAPFAFGGPTFGILVGHSHIKALKYSGGDMGLTVGGGFELLRKWQIACSYTWGMAYAEKTRLLDDFSGKNRVLSIQVSYLF